MEHKENQLHVDEEIEEIDNIIKDSLANTMDMYGVTRSVGRIYASLYLNDHPMTLDDLRDELGMSKGRMSIGVRKLIDDKLIHQVYRKGHRKSLYEAEKDFFQFFVSFFTKRWQREVNVNLQGIKKARPRYQELIDDAETPEHIRKTAEQRLIKIEESLQYYEFLDLLVEKSHSGELFDLMLANKENKKTS